VEADKRSVRIDRILKKSETGSALRCTAQSTRFPEPFFIPVLLFLTVAVHIVNDIPQVSRAAKVRTTGIMEESKGYIFNIQVLAGI
jgi:hypothetical protein